jgi:hypothetical protein
MYMKLLYIKNSISNFDSRFAIAIEDSRHISDFTRCINSTVQFVHSIDLSANGFKLSLMSWSVLCMWVSELEMEMAANIGSGHPVKRWCDNGSDLISSTGIRVLFCGNEQGKNLHWYLVS